MQDTLRSLQGVQFISFSVDPETDTPEVLSEYAARFGAEEGRWRFLTGDRRVIYDLARNGFHLVAEADSEGIAHSTKFILIDQSAMIRGYYDSDDEESMRSLITDLHSLL